MPVYGIEIILVDSDKERVIEIFKLLYRMKSSIICDMTYSLIFGIKNFISAFRFFRLLW